MPERKSHVLLEGTFSLGQVDIANTSTSNRLIDPAIEDAIEQAWARQLEAASEKGMHIYDSEAYRLNAFRANTGRLALELAPVNYSVHAAMKNLYKDARVTEQHLDKTLVADSLVKTTDDKYVFGKVNKVVENAVYLIGGTCAKSRMEITSSANLFDFAHRRAAEVLCIDESRVAVRGISGAVQNEFGCVNVIFDTNVALSSSEIVAAFRPNSGVSELIIIDETDIAAYLAKSEGYITAVTDLL